MVRFKARRGFVKANGAIEIPAEATRRPDLPLLVLLGWYQILLHADDAAAAGSAATVVVVTH